MNPLILRHSTEADNRESIELSGLLARRPCEFNWSGLNKQPEGVYAHSISESCWYAADSNPQRFDIWEIDALGLPMIHDRELPSEESFVITCDVPPDRIRRISA